MSDKKSQEYPTEDPAFDENKQEEESHHEPADEKKQEENLASDDNVSKHDDEEEEKPAEEARAPGEKKAEKPKLSPAVLIFTILNLCGLVFCAAGISIGMMEDRVDKTCISIWGYKPKCLGTWFRHMDWEHFGGNGGINCKKGDSLMQGAQAFSVMSIIGGLLTTITAFLELFHFAELAVVAAIMSFINMVAVLVVWSTMLAMYWSNLCGQGVYADTHRIGSGLALYITAWCCQFVANITIVIGVGLGQAK